MNDTPEISRIREALVAEIAASEQQAEILTDDLDKASAEIERLREDYGRACKLVADMHAAAMGEITGPALGVVEDVAALRADAERYLYICKQDFKDRQWFGSFNDYKRQRDACIDVSMRAATREQQ